MFLFPSGGGSDYEIERSLRFNSADSPLLYKVMPPTTQDTGLYKKTINLWCKRGSLGGQECLIGNVYDGSNYWLLHFNTADQLCFSVVYAGTFCCQKVSTRVFRDVSAHANFHVEFDSTQAVAEDRVKIYANDERITSFSTNTNIAQNTALYFAPTAGTWHLEMGFLNSANYLNGYLSEPRGVDGQALDPSYFGYTDPNTHQWKPKKYTGSYGTNGFYLDFSDNTSTTTLGYDRSGNGNNWTLNNFSVAEGVNNDSLLDTPTNNFATLNPLQIISYAYSALTQGNLKSHCWTGTSTWFQSTITLIGKVYAETIVDSLTGDGGLGLGIVKVANSVISPNGNSIVYWFNGYKGIVGTATAYGASYTTGDIIGIAVDILAGTITFFKNGASQGVISSSLIQSGDWQFLHSNNTSSGTSVISWNFGQRPFTYTPPEGFKALCTKNLPTPTGAAAKPWEHFGIVTRAGNQTSPRTISNLPFSPDMAWIKNRSGAYDHNIHDSVRGAGKWLSSNRTSAEATNNSGGYVSSFDTNGYTLTTGSSSYADVNDSGHTYVDWLFRAGGSAVTNTDGSITSQVSANTAAGFSIVTYTGTGANATVGHGLGVVPKMVIIKRRSAGTDDWAVWHSALTATEAVFLNLTIAKSTGVVAWNSTLPTSSVLSLGTPAIVNTSTISHVAYCFAEIPGYSKIGSYTGNGSADGPFVYCGFRPRWLMIKNISATSNWVIMDSGRSTYNANELELFAELNTYEAQSGVGRMDFVSNGYKLRTDAGYNPNVNGNTYIFMALSEAPFKYSNTR